MADVIRGFDAATDCGYIAVRAKLAGYSWIGRYFSYNHQKNISASEAGAISRAGMRILSIWEAAGDKPGTFTKVSGTREGQAAVALARAIGQPNGTAVFYTVDFDASAVQVLDAVIPYFTSAKAVTVAAGYKVGCYGSGAVCAGLKKAGLVDFTMLACARGWRGTKAYKTADVVQGMPTTLLGVPIDPEVTVRPHEAFSEFGSWSLTPNKPKPAKAKST